MKRKASEQRWVDISNTYGFYRHKYTDVRYCIHCNLPQPKSDRMPDYAVGFAYTYVECKNSDKNGRWRWSELAHGGERNIQRDWLEQEDGWLFIELGEGNAPGGKSAYLIQWHDWVDQIEPQLIELDMKSFKREATGKDGWRLGGDDLLEEWQLEWVKKADKPGGWEILIGHPWWLAMQDELTFQLQKISKLVY